MSRDRIEVPVDMSMMISYELGQNFTLALAPIPHTGVPMIMFSSVWKARFPQKLVPSASQSLS